MSLPNDHLPLPCFLLAALAGGCRPCRAVAETNISVTSRPRISDPLSPRCLPHIFHRVLLRPLLLLLLLLPLLPGPRGVPIWRLLPVASGSAPPATPRCLVLSPAALVARTSALGPREPCWLRVRGGNRGTLAVPEGWWAASTAAAAVHLHCYRVPGLRARRARRFSPRVVVVQAD